MTAPPGEPSHVADERRAAFDAEMLPHLDAVYRFARALTHGPPECEDLTQETFLQAFRHWEQYRAGSNARAWLFTICRNLFHRQRQRAARVETVDTAELESLAEAALHATLVPVDPTGRFFEAPELGDVIRDELRRLPEEFREVVALADLHDLSYADIATTLGLPVGTVKSRLFRGRRLLQEALVAYARDAGILGGKKEGGTR
jgi:RNA polymerase sigma-70 factor (ECF subfamily)